MNSARLLVATSNPNKVRELRQVLEPMGFELLSLEDIDAHVPEPVEDGETFEANARIKAQGYAQALGLACLAEDSGLEVDALGGAPGVYSARYAGVGSTREERDRENNAKLLRELSAKGDVERTARFVCAMCLVDAGGRVIFETRGTFPGEITDEPRGDNGFGYDPLLWLADAGCTSAELPPAAKNARSHRGEAARALAAWLTDHPRALR